MIDFWLLLAKFAFLALLYLFVFWVVLVMRRLAPPADAALASGFVVRLLSGPAATKSWRLSEPALIGRSPECDICLEDAAASAHHARIKMEDARWSIEDLKSRNGTFLNGRRIDSRARLDAGDRIKIGRSELVVERA